MAQILLSDGSRDLPAATGVAGFLGFEEGTVPGTPATGKWRIYFKSTGLFYIDDAGTEIGPLAVGSSDNLGNHTATQDLDMATFSIRSVDRIWSGAATGNAIDMDFGSTGIAIVTSGATNIIQLGNNSAVDFSIHDSGYFKFLRAVGGGSAAAGDLWRASGGADELFYTDAGGNVQLS